MAYNWASPADEKGHQINEHTRGSPDPRPRRPGALAADVAGGIPNFPDPGTNGGFNLGVIKGLDIDTSAPQFQSAQQTCMPILNTGGG